MIRRGLLRRLRRDRRGVTAIEFGILIGPLMLIMLATLDLGHRMYVSAVMQGAILEAVRVASIGDKTETQVDQVVKDRMVSLMRADRLSFVRKSYYQFSNVNAAEPLTSDKNGNGSYDAGDCFTDVNGNGNYDTDAAKTGLGGGDDIFYYQVTATYPRLVPLGRMLGWSDTETVQATTMMRNQPYSGQNPPATVCK